MSPVVTFMLAVVVLALLCGPLYMRMLAKGEQSVDWWRERRSGGFTVGIVLAVIGGISNLIGGIGGLTFASLLYILAAFLLSIGVTCHLMLARIGARAGRQEAEGQGG